MKPRGFETYEEAPKPGSAITFRPAQAHKVLMLALDGDDQQCVAELGMRRHQVIQQALRLASDPAVALAHPELVARICGRVERQREARAWR